jgi:hypothetical protein
MIEDLVEITERDAEMRLLLPAAAVVALESRRLRDLDREAELQRTRKRLAPALFLERGWLVRGEPA